MCRITQDVEYCINCGRTILYRDNFEPGAEAHSTDTSMRPTFSLAIDAIHTLILTRTTTSGLSDFPQSYLHPDKPSLDMSTGCHLPLPLIIIQQLRSASLSLHRSTARLAAT
ncbi:hypothetical protein CGCA056_v014787 [Colletotrichum aenigma]|uniref:uncharacterized protein n=1 Tax=Colletotrichum aenigma TaxID=1215731 RepID=UPI001872CFAF|nr:uncharacterized protein CGCA056_v014787 [Colletotrichum aenigma]KAF5502826.1 hypothetical protein CGCA056_v014787 [Colletotrichum aenigma]